MSISLLHQFKEHWAHTFSPVVSGKMLLAVSGGVDSMVLAGIFLKAGIPFAVAHCNFGLRGNESDLDEQLVSDWCNQYNITFHTNRFATAVKSEEWKKGIQETARILRYEWFEEIRNAYQYARIATAHHADDNAETLLINLFKGTGISGMHGIIPLSGYIVRPMLFAAKQQILDFAKEHHIPYREDASNKSDDYLRNAVRHHIVPAVQQWFPNAVSHMNESISRFSDAEELYFAAIERERKQLLERRGQDYYIPVLKLRNRRPLATICYELLHPFGFTSAQVPHILALLQAESGHYVVSATHRIIRNRNFLVVTGIPAQIADLVLVEQLPCTVDTGKYVFSFSIIDKPRVISADKDTASIDMRDLQFPLMLRKWRTGDYFYPLGMGMKKKKVSRLLIDQKIPLHEKEEIRVLESGRRIAWVCGLRPDERFKVTDKTGKVLLVKRREK